VPTLERLDDLYPGEVVILDHARRAGCETGRARRRACIRGHNREMRWDDRRRRRLRSRALELWLSALADVIMATTIAYAGDTMSRMGSAADLEEPVEIRVVESDLAEPFVVCAIRPRATRCDTLGLLAERP